MTDSPSVTQSGSNHSYWDGQGVVLDGAHVETSPTPRFFKSNAFRKFEFDPIPKARLWVAQVNRKALLEKEFLSAGLTQDQADQLLLNLQDASGQHEPFLLETIQNLFTQAKSRLNANQLFDLFSDLTAKYKDVDIYRGVQFVIVVMGESIHNVIVTSLLKQLIARSVHLQTDLKSLVESYVAVKDALNGGEIDRLFDKIVKLAPDKISPTFDELPLALNAMNPFMKDKGSIEDLLGPLVDRVAAGEAAKPLFANFSRAFNAAKKRIKADKIGAYFQGFLSNESLPLADFFVALSSLLATDLSIKEIGLVCDQIVYKSHQGYDLGSAFRAVPAVLQGGYAARQAPDLFLDLVRSNTPPVTENPFQDLLYPALVRRVSPLRIAGLYRKLVPLTEDVGKLTTLVTRGGMPYYGFSRTTAQKFLEQLRSGALTAAIQAGYSVEQLEILFQLRFKIGESWSDYRASLSSFEDLLQKSARVLGHDRTVRWLQAVVPQGGLSEDHLKDASRALNDKSLFKDADEMLATLLRFAREGKLYAYANLSGYLEQERKAETARQQQARAVVMAQREEQARKDAAWRQQIAATMKQMEQQAPKEFQSYLIQKDFKSANEIWKSQGWSKKEVQALVDSVLDELVGGYPDLRKKTLLAEIISQFVGGGLIQQCDRARLIYKYYKRVGNICSVKADEWFDKGVKGHCRLACPK